MPLIASTASTNTGVAAWSRPSGRTKSLTNRFVVCLRSPDRLRQLRQMRIEPFAHCDEPTARVDQVLEMHGAVLVVPELGHDDRQHRTANDARLYECAGIQADDDAAL